MDRLKALVRLGKSVLALSLAWLPVSCGPTEPERTDHSQIAELQAGAGPEYSARKRGVERFEASHPGMRLETTFERGRVLVASNHLASEGLDLAVAAIGCEGTLLPSAPASPTPDSARPNRIEYAHAGGLTEWYVNGPVGLEQGFTLRELPDCVRSGQKLVIRLAETPGWRSLVSEDGSRATLRGPNGERLLYGELRAEDAYGQELPIRVARSEGLALELETAGAALPIAVDPLVWVEQQKLTASDGVPGDAFGQTVSLSGESALVGETGDDSHKGAAYVFVRSGTSWAEQQKLTASDGAANDWFGLSVSLSGESALVGAPEDDDQGAESGSAYVFVRSGTSWTEQQKLTASDGAANDYFGSWRWAVSLSGESALVGAPEDDDKGGDSGSVYVFVRSGTSWTEQQKLTASDGASSDFFGYSVSLSGESALVGALYDDDKGTDSGSAYVFVRSGTSWAEQQKLTASDGAANDQLGSSVSLSGESALVGGSTKGSAYVFVRSGTTWSEQRKLTASDGVAGDSFGVSVSLSGESALVGASTDDDKGADSGSAYVFVRSGTSWTEQRKFTASDGAASDYFGGSVSLSGKSALVAAFADDGYKGSAYVFVFGLDDGDACVLDDECASGHCVEQVCCDAPCAAGCESCLAALKASGADGECGPTASDTDPKDACSADAASTCGKNGMCDGAGACALYPAGTECDPSSCPSATSEKAGDTCDGGGSCVVGETVACAQGYRCLAGACKTSCADDGDCSDEGYCTQSACELKKADGEECGDLRECTSGFCVDGVCCNGACDGQCEACSEAGTEGTCVAVQGDPRGEREACPPAPAGEPCKATVCDGTTRDSCDGYAGAAVTCAAASCSEAGQTPAAVCDGKGNCTAATPVPCGAYLCGATECKTSCEGNGDCSVGNRCVDGKCRSGAVCSPDGTSLIDDRNQSIPCSPYQCKNDQCPLNCLISADCVADYTCNPTSNRCEKASQTTQDDAGCGCRTVGSRGATDTLPVVVLGALIAFGVRRRRRLEESTG